MRKNLYNRNGVEWCKTKKKLGPIWNFFFFEMVKKHENKKYIDKDNVEDNIKLFTNNLKKKYFICYSFFLIEINFVMQGSIILKCSDASKFSKEP